MKDEIKGLNEVPVEFIIIIGILTFALFLGNAIIFRFPIISFVGSITADSLLYVIFLSIIIACSLLMIMMRGRMLAELRTNYEKLMLSRMYEERFRLIIDNAPIGMAVLTPDDEILHVNQALCDMLGYTPEELLGRKFGSLSYPGDPGSDLELREKLLRGEIPRYQLGKLYPRKDGVAIEAMLSVSLVKDEQENPSLFIAQIEDVTERNRARKALFEEKERLAVTLHSIHDGVIVTDIDARVILMNKVAEDLTGWTESDAVGKPLSKILRTIDIETQAECKSAVERALEIGEPVKSSGHMAIVALDGTERVIEDSAAPVHDRGKNIIGAILVFRDITERKLAEEQIKYLSYHDKLTDLYNRAYFEEQLERLDEESRLPLSLIMGDVNGLKLVNDLFGHQEGDRLLRSIAKILMDCCRDEDIVSRWGGDEFAIILPGTTERAAMEICERIRQSLASTSGDLVQPSIALGYATKEEAGQEIRQVLKEAEDRMYRNKLVEGKSARSAIISSLQRTLGERTHETEEHARRLQDLALRMGQALGLSSNQMDELALLAVLHDIGKIGIPDDILIKPGSLSKEEWVTMKKHAEIGYRIAQTSYELAHVADAILAHHEWWDGTGYPQGLKGNEIPLTSRIIAIIDAYDVMTHGRPYREAISPHAALMELKRCAGSQFDPALVEVFINMVLGLRSEPVSFSANQ